MPETIAPPPALPPEVWTENPDDLVSKLKPGHLRFVTVGHLHPILGMSMRDHETIKHLHRLPAPCFAAVVDRAWLWDAERGSTLGRTRPLFASSPRKLHEDIKAAIIDLLPGGVDPSTIWVVEFPRTSFPRPEAMVQQFLSWLAGLPADAVLAYSCQPFITPQATRLVSFDTEGGVGRFIDYNGPRTDGMYEISSFIAASRLGSPGAIIPDEHRHYWIHSRPTPK